MNIGSRLLESGVRKNTAFPFYVYEIPCKAGQCVAQSHWHEEIEILCPACDGIAELDAAPLRFSENDFLFVNREQLHKIDALSNGTLFVMVFDTEFLDFKHRDIFQSEVLDGIKHGKLRFPAHLTPSHPAYAPIAGYLYGILELHAAAAFGMETGIKSLLYALLSHCYANGLFLTPEPQAGVRRSIVDRVKSAAAFMEKNYADAITVDTLAQYVDLNKFYLIKIFKQITGNTPMVHLRNLRIERSVDLLAEGRSVTDAALMSGFNNISYYIKSFRDVKGVPPKQFVKTLTAKES